MLKFSLDFILNVQDTSLEVIKNSLIELGEGLEINDCQETEGSGKDLQIRIHTQDPTLVFDSCAQLGRIKSVKVNEGETYGA